MKKNLSLLILLPIYMAIYMASCQKSEVVDDNPLPKAAEETSIGQVGTNEVTSRSENEFDYSQCPNLKGLVYKQGDKLVFQDIEHFEKCAICLEKDYDDYNDQYEAQYPGATAEELDLLDEINLFNEWAPYITFEQSLSFSSLRAKVESQVDTWLSTTQRT